MDGEEIYANVGMLLGAHQKRKVRKSSLENQNQELEQSCAVTSSCRVAVILGLLYLLLLVGYISLLVLYSKGSSKREMGIMPTQTSSNNLTYEKDQLLTRNSNLVKEIQRLQISNNNLVKETQQLQNNYNKIIQQNDQLKKELDEFFKHQALYSEGWVSVNGSFYLISSSQKSWQDSRDDCLQRGADLVVINNHEEQEFIGRWKKLIWIGLTDIETEGTWKWVDGSLLTAPRYWAEFEPNNQGNEDCTINGFYNFQNTWNDMPCHVQSYWMCEKATI